MFHRSVVMLLSQGMSNDDFQESLKQRDLLVPIDVSVRLDVSQGLFQIEVRLDRRGENAITPFALLSFVCKPRPLVGE